MEPCSANKMFYMAVVDFRLMACMLYLPLVALHNTKEQLAAIAHERGCVCGGDHRHDACATHV